MKRIFMFSSLLLLIILGACSSPEADEVLDYHNDLVDNVNPLMDQLDESYNQLSMAETDEEVTNLYGDMVSITEEIQAFFDTQDLEHDVAKEYHEMRAEAASLLKDAIAFDHESMQQIINDELSDDEILEAAEKSEEMNNKALEVDEEAEARWQEIIEEYDFEEIEEDE